jgi:hypothetical protein
MTSASRYGIQGPRLLKVSGNQKPSRPNTSTHRAKVLLVKRTILSRVSMKADVGRKEEGPARQWEDRPVKA